MSKQTSIKKNSLVMLSSSVGSQLLLIITIPILSRLFSPSDYGLFTLFSNIAFLLIPVINGRYDLLIINSFNKKDVFIFSKLSWTISLVVILISLPLFSLYFVYSNKPVIYIILMVVLLFLVSISNITTSIFSQQNNYIVVGYINFMRTVFLIVTQLIFGYISLGSLGLIIGFVISYASGMLFSLKAWKDMAYEKNVDKSIIKKYFHDNLDQIKYSSPSILLNTLSMSLVVFAIDLMFSKIEVGYYGMSLRVLNIPITIVSLSLSKLFMQQANIEREKTGSFKKIFTKFSFTLLFVSLAMFIPLYLLPSKIFTAILGSNWNGIIMMLKLLIPMYVTKLVVTTLSLSFIILKKQRLEMLLQSLFIMAVIFVIALSKTFHLSFNEFLITFSFSFIICYAIYFYNMYKYA